VTRNKRKLQKNTEKSRVKMIQRGKKSKETERINLKNCSLLHVSYHSFLEIQYVKSETDK